MHKARLHTLHDDKLNLIATEIIHCVLLSHHTLSRESRRLLNTKTLKKKLRKNKDLSQPISRVLSGTVIYLGQLSPTASSSLPESRADHTYPIPIWPCFRWGLPCHNGYPLRGALLPHPFTLTGHE